MRKGLKNRRIKTSPCYSHDKRVKGRGKWHQINCPVPTVWRMLLQIWGCESAPYGMVKSGGLRRAGDEANSLAGGRHRKRRDYPVAPQDSPIRRNLGVT